MSTFETNARAFSADFIEAEAGQRFVLGTGEYAQSLAEEIKISAFIDEFTDEKHSHGVPIIQLSEVPADGLVVVASMLRPKSALKSVSQFGLRALDYFAFQRFSGLALKQVGFWDDFRKDYLSRKRDYDAVRRRLADSESQTVFDDIIRFRNDSNLEAMSAYQFDPVNQYFEPFLEFADSGETFVDVGSFDGSTSLEFAARVPNFTHIYAFEPAAVNIPIVRRNLEKLGVDRFTLITHGLGSEAGILKFDGTRGSSSRASLDGHSEISVRELDSFDLLSPTMLKLDIEGFEVPALQGALKTIQKHAPRVAVSVYHRYDDLRVIPEVVDQAGVSYKIYLRHYTEGIDETVMFFIPESPEI